MAVDGRVFAGKGVTTAPRIASKRGTELELCGTAPGKRTHFRKVRAWVLCALLSAAVAVDPARAHPPRPDPITQAPKDGCLRSPGAFVTEVETGVPQQPEWV